MRIRLALISLSLIAFLLTGLCFTPYTSAQDGTPVPTPDGTPNGDGEAMVQVIGLPFADTFNTDANWLFSGAWRYGIAAGYEGGGWYVDAAQLSPQAAMEHTLEYEFPIDMFGQLGALLFFRQRGNLPGSDLIAVDITFDGGETWVMVDHQIGIDAGWEQRMVDLTLYRGQVLRLRFRVSTGVRLEPDPAAVETPLPPDAEPEAIIPEGYWIDNVSIQYAELIPDNLAAFIPEIQGPHTLMGLHLVVGAKQQPVVDLARRMAELGWPLGTIKGTTDTEDILNAVAAVSPETMIVFRSLLTPWGMRDCPNLHADPVAEAQRWMYGIYPFWGGVNADYYEIMNECLPSAEWLVPFSIEAMRIASTLGKCILVFSFPPGHPEVDFWQRLTPVLDYALDNPCGPGRYHGVALHAYGVDTQTLVSQSGLYLGLRHRLLYTQLLMDRPEYARLPVYLTEAGPGDGSTTFPCEDVTRDVILFTQQLEYDPYVRGFHLWNVGPIGQFFDVTACLPMISNALANYYAAKPRE